VALNHFTVPVAISLPFRGIIGRNDVSGHSERPQVGTGVTLRQSSGRRMQSVHERVLAAHFWRRLGASAPNCLALCGGPNGGDGQPAQ
jgi:hypothetical protein